MIHVIYLGVIAALITALIIFILKARRYRHEAIHWQQAYNASDKWSDIAFYYEKQARDREDVTLLRKGFEELSMEIWGRVDESKTVGDAKEYIKVLKARFNS